MEESTKAAAAERKKGTPAGGSDHKNSGCPTDTLPQSGHVSRHTQTTTKKESRRTSVVLRPRRVQASSTIRSGEKEGRSGSLRRPMRNTKAEVIHKRAEEGASSHKHGGCRCGRWKRPDHTDYNKTATSHTPRRKKGESEADKAEEGVSAGKGGPECCECKTGQQKAGSPASRASRLMRRRKGEGDR